MVTKRLIGGYAADGWQWWLPPFLTRRVYSTVSVRGVVSELLQTGSRMVSSSILSTEAAGTLVEGRWNVMAYAQKPDFVFRGNGRVHLNRRGRQFSRLLAADVCASAVVMLDTPCSQVVWRVLTSHPILQFPLHLPSPASPCAITFQLESTSLQRDVIQQHSVTVPLFCRQTVSVKHRPGKQNGWIQN